MYSKKLKGQRFKGKTQRENYTVNQHFSMPQAQRTRKQQPKCT